MTEGEFQSQRRRAAAAARALIDGQLEWEQFVADFGDASDPQVAHLVGLIADEPEIGGPSGVSRLRYDAYRAVVERTIAALERDA